ncbi:hypothetical protein C8R43DRAFT_1012277 [Mycena crocata]|nr:hypothetical protein C8R43DRAFT_1012277 [Mycena crocata]
MSKCNCHVCWSDYSVDEFRRLGCGHCFCITCIATIQRMQNSACPECRSPISVAQVIYLDIVAAKPLESVVADGISRMDENSKLVSVRTAAKKIKQVTEQEHLDADGLKTLLAALADFNERIIPIFAKAKSQQTQIVALKTQLVELNEVKAQAARTTALSGEVTILRAEQLDLRKELKASNERRDEAREQVERGNAQVAALQDMTHAANVDAEAEMRRLKGYLERNADDRNLQKKKMRSLHLEKDSLELQVQDLTNELATFRERSGLYDIEIDEEMISEYSQMSHHAVSSSSQSIRHSSMHSTWLTQDALPSLGFEGMPGPGFGSDWQVRRGTKRKERDEAPPPGFPIALSHGRTRVTVQLGPKHTRRVK